MNKWNLKIDGTYFYYTRLQTSLEVVHKLSDILLLTICAVISGAEGWEDIEDFGETHLDFLKQYGDFENGIPVHDTIARVVSQGKIT
ncbi:transposase [Escherichia coli]|uniref:Transposase n=1 Tax=Escherichia coli TaxID=562 RepID=A0A376RM68_ECOLX|nr:transposase [Escherichia coli]